ncbi:DJ-1/PfpI family protein, partial [Micromonospora azadirachtae]
MPAVGFVGTRDSSLVTPGCARYRREITPVTRSPPTRITVIPGITVCYHWTVSTPPPAHRVAILVYDGVTLLDVAGPAEVFKEANRFGADYQIVLLSPTGADVMSNLGVRLAVEGVVSAEPTFDTFLVAGSDLYPRTPVSADLADAVRIPAAAAGRVASICTGAFV